MLGVNYYNPVVVAAHTGGGAPISTGRSRRVALQPWPGCDDVAFLPQPGPYTAMGWPIDATGLEELLLRLHRDHPDIALMVTENGAAFHDEVDAEGTVPDPGRIDYLRDDIGAVHRALRAGVDVRGYSVWSPLDNFEWSYGYSRRFGIVYVDFATQRRIPKDSARWYAAVVASGSVAATGTGTQHGDELPPGARGAGVAFAARDAPTRGSGAPG